MGQGASPTSVLTFGAGNLRFHRLAWVSVRSTHPTPCLPGTFDDFRHAHTSSRGWLDADKGPTSGSLKGPCQAAKIEHPGKMGIMASSDIRKAAILLTSLPEEQAAQLLGKLEPKQVEAVSIEIAKINSITPEEQAQAIQDFANVNPNGLTGGAGGLNVAKTLLERALGKNATATLDNVRQSIEALPFGFLQKVDSQNLVTFIIDEHPQTIALVLSHMSPAQASTVVSG